MDMYIIKLDAMGNQRVVETIFFSYYQKRIGSLAALYFRTTPSFQTNLH